MTETQHRTMEITGLVYSRLGYRIEVTDVETGEKFRWLPTDLIKTLRGYKFDGEWTTYRRSGVDIAKLDKE
ncbi:hypothetical protein ACFXG4_23445 [Nocardia sp. NPDC059246]|uniref:hypothetical protein n=1 Tax=unclassified Nocardia TaxID=2637762 RepID=UPI0036AE54E2